MGNTAQTQDHELGLMIEYLRSIASEKVWADMGFFDITSPDSWRLDTMRREVISPPEFEDIVGSKVMVAQGEFSETVIFEHLDCKIGVVGQRGRKGNKAGSWAYEMTFFEGGIKRRYSEEGLRALFRRYENTVVVKDSPKSPGWGDW